MTIEIATPPHFSFRSTVFSHGWCALPPFTTDREAKTLSQVIALDHLSPVHLTISSPAKNRLCVDVGAGRRLSSSDRKLIVASVRSCFRMDEDLTEFYREASRRPAFRWVSKLGAGRLLRAPSVFEDVVKMLCTTNCSWSLTEVMIGNLCRQFGKECSNGARAFPTPESIASSNERFLRREIRSGYRSPYLLELCRAIAEGSLDLESWRTREGSDEELFEVVRSVKGIGPYAAGNILKLLGRYDYLGIDSWTRAKFFTMHTRGRKASDKRIERHYEEYGRWKGLFFWLDVTKEWYRKEYPF